MQDLILPKKYEVNENTPEKYRKFEGRSKLSYSQYTSWVDPLYKLDYIQQYMLGFPRTSNIFAEFGSACGAYFEKLEVDYELLSNRDVSVLEKLVRPDDAVYEGEIVIDLGNFVVQGFIDQEYFVKNLLTIEDLKTGNTGNKVSFYGGPKYQQTTLYAHTRILEGYELGYSGVTLLGRKGRGDQSNPLYLTGDIIRIPTPYSKERAEMAMSHIRAAAYEISECYQLLLKLNK